MAATYGALRWSAEKRAWLITAAPQVVIKLKRWFSQIAVYHGGELRLSDTLDNARDLEMPASRRRASDKATSTRQGVASQSPIQALKAAVKKAASFKKGRKARR